MKIIKYLFTAVFAFLGIVEAASCSVCDTHCMSDTIRERLHLPPNYTDSSQWYKTDRRADADIFYIISTEIADYKLADGSNCHYADTYSEQIRTALQGEMEGVDNLISGQMNFYSPFYRQCTLQSFVNDSLMAARMVVPISDVRRAFEYYIKNENNGRPFVLVGFSQGAILALQLLSDMTTDVSSRMVAAYLIGIPVTEEILAANPLLCPAKSASDTGVIVCYNSVRDASCSLWDRSAVCINPVNWSVDDTPATLITEPSPLITSSEQKKDTLTITLDKESNLLFVDGYTATDYIIPIIGKEGNYHSREIWLYRDCLRENIQHRTKQFFRTRKQ